MADLDDRYGHPEFKMTIPICSVCKHYSNNLECTLNKDIDKSKKWGESFDCKYVDYNKNTTNYEWYIKLDKKRNNSKRH